MLKITSKPVIRITGPPAPDAGFPFEATVAQEVKIKGRKVIASCRLVPNDFFRVYLTENLRLSPSDLHRIIQGMEVSVVVE